MRLTRRRLLALLGGGTAVLVAPPLLAAPARAVIEMRGSPRGARVWFAPIGLAVAPGTRVRFVNRDAGNSHTATAYHPELFGRSRRIPEAATPFHSDFLLPGDDFEVTLSVPGVYDYYCLPHERAGMVGRVVVGTPAEAGWRGPPTDGEGLPTAALAALPPVEEILAQGRIQPEDMR